MSVPSLISQRLEDILACKEFFPMAHLDCMGSFWSLSQCLDLWTQPSIAFESAIICSSLFPIQCAQILLMYALTSLTISLIVNWCSIRGLQIYRVPICTVRTHQMGTKVLYNYSHVQMASFMCILAETDTQIVYHSSLMKSFTVEISVIFLHSRDFRDSPYLQWDHAGQQVHL